MLPMWDKGLETGVSRHREDGSITQESFCHFTIPEPMDIGGTWGVRGRLEQGRRSQPCWGSLPYLEQQRLLEVGSTAHNSTKDVIT